jgi:prepilin-type N-terminal cleavage/methylation domain-containing protein
MNKKGFTLIEVMIATGLFAVLMVFGVAAILNTNVLFKKNQSQRAVLDNMSFIAEDMIRSIRTGRSFHCVLNLNAEYASGMIADPQDCPVNGSAAFAFEAQGGSAADPQDQVVFLVTSDGLYKDKTSGLELITNIADAPKITDSRIEFDVARSGFNVFGSAAGDGKQPVVVVRLAGQITDAQSGAVTPFSYQFSSTQRATDS